MTKEEKILLYNNMLKRVETKYRDKNYSFYLCAILILCGCFKDIDELLELERHRPHRKDGFWFPLNNEGAEKRIAIIKAAIKEVTNG